MRPEIVMVAWGLILCLFLLPEALAQEPDPKLPNRSSQRLAIAKEDYEKSKKDIAEILRLAQQLETEIEENREFVVDLGSVRKVETVEKLARRIKNRMKRFQ
jgi:hypothetical protein